MRSKGAIARRDLVLAIALVLVLLSTGVAAKQGMGAGGAYTLASPSWQVSGTASGGGYQVQSAAAPALRGSGGCCTYIPLVQR
jgi:uncharacterized membrane protein